MSELRDKIAKVTGFYFSEKTPLSNSFVELQKAGRFDNKTVIKVLGVLCDFIEAKELEKKN